MRKDYNMPDMFHCSNFFDNQQTTYLLFYLKNYYYYRVHLSVTQCLAS